MKTKDTLIGAAVFLSCTATGMLCTKLIVSKSGTDDSDRTEVIDENFGNEQQPTTKPTNPRGGDKPAPHIGMKENENEQPITNDTLSEAIPQTKKGDTAKVSSVVTIEASPVQMSKHGYSVVLSAKNLPLNATIAYEIWDKSKCIAKSKTGEFSRIPGNAKGEYTAKVRNTQTNEVLCELTIAGFFEKTETEEKSVVEKKMTSSEFQRLLLSNDHSIMGGRNPKVAKNIKINVKGIRSGERHPDDILAIREKISYGTWRTALVRSVSYDQSGKVNEVTIEPVYPDGDDF